MLVKTYAKKLKGGNGYRRFMLLFHFLLWLVATAALLLCSLELLGTLGIEAVDGAVAKVKDLAAPVSAPAFELILMLVADILLWASAIMCIISGVIYLLDNKDLINPEK